MRRACIIFLVVTACAPVSHVAAADKKPLSLERMGQLLTILRSDLNEDNRAQAARELSGADGAQYPEVASYLIEALRHDPKPAVRCEALESLVRLRPITTEAGKAIDAAKEDGSFKVRWKARTASRTYHAAGYQDPGAEKKAATPPAPPSPKTASSSPATPTGGWLYKLMAKPNSDPARTSPYQTPQPPLADPFPGAVEPVPPPSFPAPTPASNPFEGLKSPPAAPAPTPVMPNLPSKGPQLGPEL